MRSRLGEHNLENDQRTTTITRIYQLVWVAGLPALAWLMLELASITQSGKNSPRVFIAEILVIAAWASGLVAAIRLRSAYLAYSRILSASGVVWGALAAVARVNSGALVLGWGLISMILCFSPQIQTEAAARDSAPRERRFPLAVPVGLLLFMVIPSTLLVGGAVGVLPAWLLGLKVEGIRVPLVILGLLASPAIFLSLHRLTRRWLVAVPAGVVLHDPVLLVENYRLTPEEIAWIEFAPVKWRQSNSKASIVDATGGCISRPLLIVLDRPMPGPMLRPNRKGASGLIRAIACRPVNRLDALTTLHNAGYERISDHLETEDE